MMHIEQANPSGSAPVEQPRSTPDVGDAVRTQGAAPPRIRWMAVAVAALLGAAVAWGLAALQPQRYRASSISAVAPVTAGVSNTDVIRGVESLDGRVVLATVAALVSTPATRIAAGAGEYAIEAAVLPNTSLFRVTAEGPDAARATQIANTVPEIIARQARSIYPVYYVQMVSKAQQPTTATTPRVERALITGLLAGAALGLVASWALERRRLA